MNTSDFLQSNMALNNTIRQAMENSTEETWKNDLRKALEPFGEDVVNNLDHLKFG